MNHIFLNRWGIVFHAILTTVTDEEDRVLASRVCTLDEARRLIEKWQIQYAVASHDIHDNSQIDLNKLLAGIETDFMPRNN